MKKMIDLYDNVSGWLCSIGADKYLHLLCGLLIAFVTGSATGCCLYGMAAGALAGVIKELLDYVRHKSFDTVDLLFATIGSMMGSALGIVSII